MSETSLSKKLRPELKRLIDDDPKLTSLCVVGTLGVGVGMIGGRRGGRPRKRIKGVEHFFAKKPEDWQNLGQAIISNTNLRQLYLHDIDWGSPPPYYLRVFYSHLRLNRSIDRLDMHNLNICDGAFFSEYLYSFFENNPNFRSLNANMIDMDINGMARLCNSLGRMQHSLKYLDLTFANISDGDCAELIAALTNNHLGLRSLELCNNAIEHEGCNAIAEFLAHPDCMLVRLNLDGNNVDDDGIFALCALGLDRNARLKTLSLSLNSRISLRGYGACVTVLCDGPSESTIDDFLSINNDTIQRISIDWGSPSAALPDDTRKKVQYVLDTIKTRIQISLNLNRLTNKQTVANQKFTLNHLVYREKIDLFESIPGVGIPLVLATIVNHSTHNGKRTDANAVDHCNFVRTDYIMRLNALYSIIRQCPHVVCERRGNGGSGGELHSASSQGEDQVSPSSKKIRLNVE